MAERKPLIPPTAAPSTILARIVAKDQHRSGRAQEEPASTNQTDSQGTGTQLEQARSDEAEDSRRVEGRREVDPVELEVRSSVPRSKSNTPQNRSQIRRDMEARAKTAFIPVTLRLPTGLNDWLDTFVFEHRKEGVRKQDLIAEALLLLAVGKELQE